MRLVKVILLTGCALAFVNTSNAATLAATYQFGNTLAADQGGVAALTNVNPLGTNAFVADTVFGNARTVFAFNGNGSPPTNEAGLSLDTTGLIPANDYTVELIFEFTQNANAWRRILDVQNRASDNGFYVDPGNNLNVFPVSGSSAAFTNNAYHHVVLTDSGGTVKGFLDGGLQFTLATTVMDINNVGNLMNFFLDNTAGGGQGEYSSGRIALARLYTGALTDGEVRNLAADPFPGPTGGTPEPSTWMMLGGGLVALTTAKRARRA